MQSRVFWKWQGTQSLPSPGKTLGKACKAIFRKEISKYWDDNLHKLSVQSKFLNACDLEKSNRAGHE